MFELTGYRKYKTLFESNTTIIRNAIRNKDQLPVVIKFLKKKNPTHLELIRFTAEYELIRDLDIDGVISVYSLEKINNNLAIVMEDIGGKSIDRMLPFVNLSITEIIVLLNKITIILGKIHQSQIIHKSINPSNIIWNKKTNQLRIIDFGISTQLSSESQDICNPNLLEGSIPYISPEQTGRMNRAIDYRSDLYSLGITFYEILTGQNPFKANDLLEWCHCHLAEIPVSPHKINNKIPLVLSRIILKLLSKDAEERYQSCSGLSYDLNLFINKNKLNDFQIGTKDSTYIFRLPENIYGRDQEIKKLLTLYNKTVSDGSCQIALLSGSPGIGKSSIVHELFKPITQTRGTYLFGKFDQYRQNIPYDIIVQVFKTLIKYIISQDNKIVAWWKKRILKAVGINGKVITDLIPDLIHLIGEQPPIPDIAPNESINRFNMVFQNFVNILSSSDNPLVIFFDDMQGVDIATINLLEKIITDSRIKHIMYIFAYRDNEVNDSHPFKMMLDKIRYHNFKPLDIHLQPLKLKNSKEFIIDTLHLKKVKKDNIKLFELFHKKTGGNPFFMKQFFKRLHHDGLIKFDSELEHFVCSSDDVESQGYTDNVIENMIQQLLGLDKKTLEAIHLAACIGTSFKLSDLSLISNKSIGYFRKVFWPTFLDNLIIPQGYTTQFLKYIQNEDLKCVFQHDRIHQAAYTMLDKKQQTEIHLKIGRAWKKQYDNNNSEENLFKILDQLNRSIELITDRNERFELSKMNLRAGILAKASTAYFNALKYLNLSFELLPEQTWSYDYNFTFLLNTELAECEYLTGNFDLSNQRFTQIFEQTESVLDKANLCILRMRLVQVSGNYSLGVDLAIKALEMFDIIFPKDNQSLDYEISEGLKNVGPNMAGRQIKELKKSPRINDPSIKAIVDLAVGAMPCAYIARPNTFPYFSLLALNTSLCHGNTESSCFAYSAYGFLLISILNDPRSAYEFSTMSLELNEIFGDLKLRGTLLHLHGDHFNYWSKPIVTDFPFLEKGFIACQEVGDLVYSNFIAFEIIWQFIELGYPLEEIFKKSKPYLAFAEHTHNLPVFHTIRFQQQFIACLQGKTSDPVSLSDKFFDEKESLRIVTEASFGCGIVFYHVIKQILYFFNGEFQKSLESARAVEPYIGAVSAMPIESSHYFMKALILCSLYTNENVNYRNEIDEVISKFKIWHDNCPENFSTRYFLLKAEVSKIDGDFFSTIKYYDESISEAQKNNFIHMEFLSRIQALQFYKNKGLNNIFSCNLSNAVTCCKQLGSLLIIEQLKKNFSQLNTKSFISVDNDSFTLSDSLDIETVLKLTKTISKEIRLDSLVSSLISIAIENAGADHGYLILLKDEKAFVLDESGEMHPLEIFNTIAKSPIDYTIRTKESVILSNAFEDNIYGTDPYIKENTIRSLLCIPIILHNKINAVLYLENRILFDAFTYEHISILRLVASQAAVSIENALTFENLNKERDYSTNIIRNSPSLICGINNEGITTFINPVIERITGYSESELIGKNWWNIFYPGKEYDQVEKLFKLIEKQNIDNYEMTLTCKNGDRKNILWNSFIIKDPESNKLEILGFGNDITESKRAAISLRQSEAHLRTLVETIPDLVWLKDPNGVYLSCNRKFERLFGMKESEIIGKTDYDFVDKELADFFHKNDMEAILKNKASINEEEINYADDGHKEILETIKIPMYDSENKLIGVLGIARDITSRKWAEEALRKSEERFRAAFESAQDCILIWDKDYNYLYANQAAIDHVGTTRDKVIGKNIKDGLGHIPEFMHLWMKRVDEVFQKGEVFHFQDESNINGQIIYSDSIATPLCNKDGSVSAVCVVYRDVSERKLAEEKLENQQKQYLAMFDGMDEVVYVADPDTFEMLFLNKKGENIWGDWIGKKCYKVLQDRDSQCPFCTNNKIFGEKLGETYIWEFQNEIDRQWYRCIDRAILWSDGRMVRYEMAIDITEQKKQQAELQYLRNYLTNIIDSMPSMLIGVDIDGKITQWNKKSSEVTGIAPKDAYGKKLSDVFPDMTSEIEKISESIKTREIKYQQKKQRQSENGVFYEDVTIYPLIANGIDGAVIRIDDVSEFARMEEMMIQSEKMLSVGGLAAGMAHEINNPLAGMIQTAHVMSNRLYEKINIPANLEAAKNAGTTIEAIRSFMEARGIPRMITTINESGKRVAAIVKNMLSFARKSDSNKLPHYLSEIIDNTLKLAATDYDLKKHFDFRLIKIIKEYQNDLPSVFCEHSKIQQVILNILRNGSQAMHEANIDNPKLIIKLKYEKHINMISIEIEDNGPGMNDEIRKRIFEPFFTTKAVGVGTGLGLSVSYFIITENHDGEMEVESQPGKGTKFIIRLPVNEPNSEIPN